MSHPWLPRGLLAAAVALAVAAVSWSRLAVHHAAATTPAAASIPRPVAPASMPAGAGAATVARRDPVTVLREGSLRGTQVDGAVDLGFAGHVRPDLALRRLFDYYLTLLGETDLDGIRKLLLTDLHGRALDPSQIAEVMAIFQRYTDYQQAIAALVPRGSLIDRLKQLQTLREAMLGQALADAFYPDARRQLDALQARLAINSDRSLSVAEKTRRLQALEASAAPEEQAATAQAVAGATLQTQTDQFNADHVDAADRYAQRAAQYGSDAADRLAALDQQRQQWQARLDAYAAQSAAIRADATLDAAQQQQALLQWQQQNFSAPELLQVQAMERSGLLPRH